MEFAHFFHRVTTRERGIAQRLRLQKIYRLSTESVGYPVGPAALFEARLLVGKLEEVRKQIRDIKNSIEYVSLDFAEYSHLLTIPGFGPYISSKVLAIIGDPFRFDNRRQVLKMAGFDLCANRSGNNSDRAVPVISKKGNSEFRYALYGICQ